MSKTPKKRPSRAKTAGSHLRDVQSLCLSMTRDINTMRCTLLKADSAFTKKHAGKTNFHTTEGFNRAQESLTYLGDELSSVLDKVESLFLELLKHN